MDGRWFVVRLSPSVPLYQRHVDAIVPALRALDAPEEILDKVRSLVEEEGEGFTGGPVAARA